jgi:ABC-type polysaccharide/polyol phosphate export permease
VLAQLFDLFIASLVLVILLVVAKVSLSLQLLWAGPLLALTIALAIGVGLIVSAGSLFFRDVKYIVEVFLTFAIFFTPVFYDVSIFGAKGKWLLLNPVAPVLEGFSSIVRGQAPNWDWLAYSLTFTAVMVLMAYALFKKVEPVFAENI